MSDMLVNLMTLPSCDELCLKLEKEENVVIRRGFVPDMYRVLEFVEKNSGLSAKGECAVCFAKQPTTCFIATRYDEILGYACFDATTRDYFGPTRVLETERGKGIGKALLIRSLEAMKEMGYVYAVIGFVGPAAFYEKSVGAFMIPNSYPGPYKDMLSLNKKEEE
ncbi:MAG: GNAT family N-acetyltransferase [Spirochaetales bacterium]|nr:GNAT family N-acetyltransferase [Spirochaetales bacterium]